MFPVLPSGWGTNPLIEATLIDQDANDMRFMTGNGRTAAALYPGHRRKEWGARAGSIAHNKQHSDARRYYRIRSNKFRELLQSNSLIIGAYATDADGMDAGQSNAVPNVNYPLQLQPRGGNFSVGRVTATLAKATFAAVALPGRRPQDRLYIGESTEGNKRRRRHSGSVLTL